MICARRFAYSKHMLLLSKYKTFQDRLEVKLLNASDEKLSSVESLLQEMV